MSFNVETTGSGCPAGQVVRYTSGPGGTTVMLSDHACADEGRLHELVGMGNVREPPAPSNGPPNVPGALRVSAMRHGATGWKYRAPGDPGAAKYPLISMITFVASLTNTLTAPPVPAGTIAALAAICPWFAFSVETTG